MILWFWLHLFTLPLAHGAVATQCAQVLDASQATLESTLNKDDGIPLQVRGLQFKPAVPVKKKSPPAPSEIKKETSPPIAESNLDPQAEQKKMDEEYLVHAIREVLQNGISRTMETGELSRILGGQTQFVHDNTEMYLILKRDGVWRKVRLAALAENPASVAVKMIEQADIIDEMAITGLVLQTIDGQLPSGERFEWEGKALGWGAHSYTGNIIFMKDGVGAPGTVMTREHFLKLALGEVSFVSLEYALAIYRDLIAREKAEEEARELERQRNTRERCELHGALRGECHDWIGHNPSIYGRRR